MIYRAGLQYDFSQFIGWKQKMAISGDILQNIAFEADFCITAVLGVRSL